MHTPSTNMFGPVEETNDENIEYEEVEEEQEEAKGSLKKKRLAAPKRKEKLTTKTNQIPGVR